MRQRIIFVGVREDLKFDPVHPTPLSYRYSVRDALPWISKHSIKPSGTYEPKFVNSFDNPAQAIVASGGNAGSALVETGRCKRRKFTIAELKRICAFPDDFELKGSYAQQWERLGNSVPPLMMKAVAEKIRDEVLLRWA